MKKRNNRSQMIIIGAFCVFGLGLVLALFGLSKTVANIDKIAVSKEPEAILASAGVSDGMDVDLPVAYFDQRADACVNMYDTSSNDELAKRQFEWTSCGYSYKQLEQGMVGYELNENYLPVAVGGNLIANRGLDMTRWFGNVEGKSKEYADTLKLNYKAGSTVEFSFNDEDFYPLDEIDFSSGDKVNVDGHNHLFTMNFAVPFTVTTSGDESFEIVADDDTFVYVEKELALDMGGIHEALTGKLTINEAGEVYTGVGEEELAYSGIQVAKDEGSIVRIFHADRDAEDSVLKMRFSGMNLTVVQTQLADADGVQVAYDPADPSYVGPLGVIKVFQPDGTRGNMIILIVLSVVVVTCAMFTVILAHSYLKSRAQK